MAATQAVKCICRCYNFSIANQLTINHSMSLHEKKVVIIGGSSGIGLATASAALDHGANVIIASRSEQKLKAANQTLANKAETAIVDTTCEASLRHLFDSIGAYDHLQLPGSVVHFGDLNSLSMADARASFDSKFWGVLSAIQYGQQRIADNGSITLYSGAASQRASSDSFIVTAVNSAIEGLCKSLAISLSPVRVNVISPGLIMTPIFENLGQQVIDEVFATYEPQMLVKRYGKAEEVAAAALFLMTNHFTTGSRLQIDGGLSIT